MLRRLPLLLLCALFALTLPACDSGGDGNGDGDGNGNGGIGAGLAATIDGERFVATGITAAGRDEDDNGLGLGGRDAAGNTFSLVVGGLTEGTYAVNTDEGTGATYASQTGQFVTLPGTDTGTIRVTSISADRVQGAFSFTMTSLTGGGTIEVTAGEFDVAFLDN